MARQSTSGWTPALPEPTPSSNERTKVASERIPPLPAPGSEQTPSNGWDLLDDYQVGKDVNGADAAQTARIASQVARTPLPESPVPERRDNPAETKRTTRTTMFWRNDGSAAQDAEVMARIMAREQEYQEEAQKGIERAKAAKERDERELVRERQRREIDAYLAMQKQRSETEQQLSNSLQQMMQDAANIFLALGICPDHLEYLPDLGQFCSWGGRLYDHREIFAMRDARNQPAYEFGPSPHGASTACYSIRERKWRLHHPVAPTELLIPVERLLPVPKRHADGSVRFSAKRARTILMEEGSFTVFVVRNAVFTTAHLRAAHFRDATERRGIDPLTAAAAANGIGAPADAAGDAPGRVGAVVDAATSAVTRMFSNTTRLFRRDRS